MVLKKGFNRLHWMVRLAVTKLFLVRHKPEFDEHLASQTSNNVWKT